MAKVDKVYARVRREEKITVLILVMCLVTLVLGGIAMWYCLVTDL